MIIYYEHHAVIEPCFKLGLSLKEAAAYIGVSMSPFRPDGGRWEDAAAGSDQCPCGLGPQGHRGSMGAIGRWWWRYNAGN